MVSAAVALMAIAWAATAHAATIKLKCRILGPMDKLYGLLSVTVDPEGHAHCGAASSCQRASSFVICLTKED